MMFPKAPRETAAAKQTRKRAEAFARKVKPTSERSIQRVADRRAQAKHVADIRRQVWARSKGLCEVCGDTERQTAQKWPKAQHEMHEHPMRSKTRGLPLDQRFSLAICKRVCGPCHKAAHHR